MAVIIREIRNNSASVAVVNNKAKPRDTTAHAAGSNRANHAS